MTWETRITIWEPGRHLCWTDPVPEGESDAPVTAIDFMIEADGQTVTLRLVHSGFSAGEEWDEQYYGTESGWIYFLYNLKHYLERHFGTARELLSARYTMMGTRSEIWTEVMTSVASVIIGAGPNVDLGSLVQLNFGAGELHEGIIEVLARGRNIGVRIPALDESLLFIEIEPGAKDTSVGFWLSGYGSDHLKGLRDSFDARVRALTGN